MMLSFLRWIRILLLSIGCALLGGTTSMIAFAQSVDPNAMKPFPPADVFSGTAHERGEAYGKLFKDRIRDLLETEIYGPLRRPSLFQR